MKLPGIIEIFKLGTYSVVLNDDGQRSSHNTAAADGRCILEFRCVAAPAVNFTSFVQCNESMGPYRLSKHPSTLGASAPQMAKIPRIKILIQFLKIS
jgi:hypothetical protein